MDKRMSRPVVWLILPICLVLILLPLPTASSNLADSNGTLPPHFTDTLVASIDSPTALAFTPDGRMLITTQPGLLAVYKDGALYPALDLAARICSDRERGLLGVAVDPEFAANRFIYLYYTFNWAGTPECERNTRNSPVNRVARFILSDDGHVDLAGEVVLIDNIPSPNGNHNAGDLHFGKNSYLYISVGDGGCDYADDTRCGSSNDAARDEFILLGKILRITRDGEIPDSNPFLGEDSARCGTTGRTEPGKKCQETFAWGLRNPFRIAFDPNTDTTRFFINDVGQNTWEEINRGKKGADYGWNRREGRCVIGSTTNCPPRPEGQIDPIYTYPHSTGCTSITGGAFLPNGVWPSEYDGAYLFGDYVCGTIFMLTPKQDGGYVRSPFVSNLGTRSAVAMIFGPYGESQALYYTTYAAGGQVRRITYTGVVNRAPAAVALAQPSAGAIPLEVRFDAGASSDPEGDTLTYAWDFGDGATDTGSAPVHTYTSPGVYNVQLRVQDSAGASDTATLRIDAGNTAPLPVIAAPAASVRFQAGQAITLQGSASDAEDGVLPDSALSWRVILHHDTHTHPFLPATSGNNIGMVAPGPEDLAAATNSYLEIELTATDSWGLSTVITQELRPNLVDVTFVTEPPGLHLQVNERTLIGAEAVVSWEQFALNVNVPDQQDENGQVWEFAGWSDGGAAAHTIVTPSSAATYTATLRMR